MARLGLGEADTRAEHRGTMAALAISGVPWEKSEQGIDLIAIKSDG